MIRSKFAAVLLLFLQVGSDLSAQQGKPDSQQASQGNGANEALSIAERTDREIHFETKIRPILVNECLKCHNEKKISGGLDLSNRNAVKKGGDSGIAVKPGDARNSLIVKAIERRTADIAPMPPKKTLTKEQIADIVRWVNDGAHWPDDALQLQSNASFNSEGKTHWSFQPVVAPKIPQDSSGWARSPVDRFIAAGWNGLKPAEDADELTLIRRVSYDLTGLPPNLVEVNQAINRKAEKQGKSFDLMVDKLLNSPAFGERWARHWMDVVRYADTAGDNADYPVPEARFYRDYLIDSFNADKPFNQLVVEHISGDLMAVDLARDGRKLNTAELKQFRDFNVATTFIGLSRRYATAPFELMHLTVEDSITTTGQAFLGLNFRCARCHDHKYDPISMRDYYGLYSIFASTSYPYAGSEEFQSKKLPRSGFISLKPESEIKPALEEYRRQIEKLKQCTTEFTGPFTPEVLQKQKVERIKIEIDRRLGGWPAGFETAYGVAEGKPHDEPLHRKGEPRDPGEVVARAVPEFLEGFKRPTVRAEESGRRELAEWLTDPANPLTARVYVNRVWMQLFGRGLVETPNDFGTRGSKPTHPELLDYLTNYFIENDWSTKSLVRAIVCSRVYQLCSDDFLQQSRIDPENRRLWRHNRRRLDAESIRDSLLAISGNLNLARPGTHPFPPIENWKWTQHDPFREQYDTRHRTVYLMTQRIQKHPFLALFDGPDTNSSTGSRSQSSVPLQSLHLSNHPFFIEQSNAIAARLHEKYSVKGDPTELLNEIWKKVLGRLPDKDELQLTGETLKSACEVAGESPQRALQSMIHSLFMSNAFLYVD